MQYRAGKSSGWKVAGVRSKLRDVSVTLAALTSLFACSPPPSNPIGNTALPNLQDDLSTLNSKAVGSAENLQLFLLFGQSNMEGIPLPETEDVVVNPRIQVLGYENGCGERRWNQWAFATPPLHRCWAGVGPGDWFAKTLAEAWPSATIGLVPAAISGAPIALYRKEVVADEREVFELPPSNGWSGGYEMLVARARVAQASGTIRGILFHQGEADVANREWLAQVAEVVADLRRDLGLSNQVPFIAGELVYDGCCSDHNTVINQLPERVPNAHVVSAAGLTATDEYHFDLAGQRELGKRYADVFLDAVELAR